MPNHTKTLTLQLHLTKREHLSFAELNFSTIRFLQFSHLVLLTILAVLITPLSRAEDKLIIAGIQGSSQSSYSYLGLIQPLEKSELGKGWYRKSSLPHPTNRHLQTTPTPPITHLPLSTNQSDYGHEYQCNCTRNRGRIWSCMVRSSLVG